MVGGGSCIPAVGGPGTADQATDGDDRVGEVEEGFDDVDPPFVAPREPVEGVLPGVGALDMPPLSGLDRCLGSLVGDPATQTSLAEQGARLGRVIARVEVHGDLVGQWTKFAQEIESWSQER